jgi:mono/diheme cytochrome c family protein
VRWRGLVLLVALLRVQAEDDATSSPEVARVVPDPGPSWGAIVVAAPPADPARVSRGAALYAQRCAACHGGGLFAPDLPFPPRDLAAEPLRTRDRSGPVSQEELYRTITVGAPAYGMPSFGHLAEAERWALASFVGAMHAVEPGPARPPLPRETAIDLELGRATFSERCAACHGAAGDGRGPAGAALADARGRPAPPTDFTRGPAAFRGGARREDIARTVHLGRPGTAMAPVDLPPDALWSVAAHVSRLADEGLAARRRAWTRFYGERRQGSRVEDQTDGATKASRFDPARSADFAVAPAERRGCTACHGGIADIATGTMARAIDAFAGGDADRACAVCHEGRPEAARKDAAHDGFVPNPGSLWATSVGLGCGKCHSERDALITLQGRPLPEPTGGALLSVRSRRTDPTGASGANHAYRLQRALMAQESGKAHLVAASTGLAAPDAPRHTDFAVDDPDGAVPCAGGPAYREAMARAYETGHVRRLPRGEPFPTFAEARALTDDDAAAAYADVYRKDCARCHLWGEGRATPGEHRSSGCSACHVLTGRDGRSLGDDPTIPANRAGHPLRHRLELAIPEEQCNHCHTRGEETRHTDGHQQAGIGCVDCHTSIDVHGDGNLYPSIQHQLEVECEDCHGTPTRAPWELPLLPGTPAEGEGPRGVHGDGALEHLLTSRGNARANWLRRGERVVLVSLLDGREHEVPLLRDRVLAPAASPTTAHAQAIPGHDALACAACHGSSGPRCGSCHIDYFASDRAQDWLLSAADHDPVTLRQRLVLTPGALDRRDDGTSVGNPELRRDGRGRLAPQVPGCRTDLRYVPARGT